MVFLIVEVTVPARHELNLSDIVVICGSDSYKFKGAWWENRNGLYAWEPFHGMKTTIYPHYGVQSIQQSLIFLIPADCVKEAKIKFLN